MELGLANSASVKDDFVSTNEELVTFVYLPHTHMSSKDMNVHYSLGSRVTVSPQDWIGIFSSQWSDCSRPHAFQWACSTGGSKKKPKRRSVTFPAQQIQSVQSHSGPFKILYVNRDSQVIGMSAEFMLKRNEKWEHVSLSKVDSPISDLSIISLEGATASTESLVLLTSDDDWEPEKQMGDVDGVETNVDTSLASDTSDIVVLSFSPSKDLQRSTEEVMLKSKEISMLLENKDDNLGEKELVLGCDEKPLGFVENPIRDCASPCRKKKKAKRRLKQNDTESVSGEDQTAKGIVVIRENGLIKDNTGPNLSSLFDTLKFVNSDDGNVEVSPPPVNTTEKKRKKIKKLIEEIEPVEIIERINEKENAKKALGLHRDCLSKKERKRKMNKEKKKAEADGKGSESLIEEKNESLEGTKHGCKKSVELNKSANKKKQADPRTTLDSLNGEFESEEIPVKMRKKSLKKLKQLKKKTEKLIKSEPEEITETQEEENVEDDNSPVRKPDTEMKELRKKYGLLKAKEKKKKRTLSRKRQSNQVNLTELFEFGFDSRNDEVLESECNGADIPESKTINEQELDFPPLETALGDSCAKHSPREEQLIWESSAKDTADVQSEKATDSTNKPLDGISGNSESFQATPQSELTEHVPGNVREIMDSLPAPSCPAGDSLSTWRKSLSALSVKHRLPIFKAKHKSKFGTKSEAKQLSRVKEMVSDVKKAMEDYKDIVSHSTSGLDTQKKLPVLSVHKALLPEVSPALGPNKELSTESVKSKPKAVSYANIVKTRIDTEECPRKEEKIENSCVITIEQETTRCQDMPLDLTLAREIMEPTNTDEHSLDTVQTKDIKDQENRMMKAAMDDTTTEQPMPPCKVSGIEIEELFEDSIQTKDFLSYEISESKFTTSEFISSATSSDYMGCKNILNRNKLECSEVLDVQNLGPDISLALPKSKSLARKVNTGGYAIDDKKCKIPEKSEDQLDLLDMALTSTLEENRQLREEVAYLNKLHERSEAVCKEAAEISKTAKTSIKMRPRLTTKGKHIVLKSKIKPCLKCTGIKKTGIQLEAENLKLRSENKRLDRTIADLENLNNTLKEALNAEEKRTTKAQLKTIKLKLKLKQARGKLRAIEEESREEDELLEEPPLKKRKLNNESEIHICNSKGSNTATRDYNFSDTAFSKVPSVNSEYPECFRSEASFVSSKFDPLCPNYENIYKASNPYPINWNQRQFTEPIPPKNTTAYHYSGQAAFQENVPNWLVEQQGVGLYNTPCSWSPTTYRSLRKEPNVTQYAFDRPVVRRENSPGWNMRCSGKPSPPHLPLQPPYPCDNYVRYNTRHNYNDIQTQRQPNAFNKQSSSRYLNNGYNGTLNMSWNKSETKLEIPSKGVASTEPGFSDFHAHTEYPKQNSSIDISFENFAPKTDFYGSELSDSGLEQDMSRKSCLLQDQNDYFRNDGKEIMSQVSNNGPKTLFKDSSQCERMADDVFISNNLSNLLPYMSTENSPGRNTFQSEFLRFSSDVEELKQKITNLNASIYSAKTSKQQRHDKPYKNVSVNGTQYADMIVNKDKVNNYRQSNKHESQTVLYPEELCKLEDNKSVFPQYRETSSVKQRILQKDLNASVTNSQELFENKLNCLPPLLLTVGGNQLECQSCGVFFDREYDKRAIEDHLAFHRTKE